MTNKIEISRELAVERLTEIANRDSAVSVTVRAEDLRALLAAPAVERQPVAYMRNEGTPNNLVMCTFTCPGAFGVYRGPQSLSALPVPVAVTDLDVEQLAQIIREVDGSHSLGAGALAERILDKVKEMNQ